MDLNVANLAMMHILCKSGYFAIFACFSGILGCFGLYFGYLGTI